MDFTNVVPLVVIGLVALAVVFGIRAVVRQRRQHAEDLAQLTPEQRALHEQCVEADKLVRAEESTHKKNVREAQRALANAQKVDVLARVGFNYVSPVEISMNGKKHPMAPDVRAWLESEGDVTAVLAQKSKITTGGGIGVGALNTVAVGGRVKEKNKNGVVKVDSRELFLLATGTGWAEAIKLEGSQGDVARKFALAATQAAQNNEAFLRDHAEQVARFQTNLDTVSSDTSRLDHAKAARAALGDDPLEAVRAARKAAVA